MTPQANLSVVWPAIGRPAVMKPGDSELLVLMHGKHAPTRLTAALTTIPLRGISETVELELVTVATASLSEYADLGNWSIWAMKQWREVFAARFRVPSRPAIEAPIRTLLCDLMVMADGEPIPRPGAVAFHAGGSQPFRGIFAADIHVAYRWQTLEREVERDFDSRIAPQSPDDATPAPILSTLWSRESFTASFHNPNRHLQTLIRIINDEARTRGIDGVFFVGDLVDFKYHRDPLLNERGVEWSLFIELLTAEGDGCERLRVPCFTSTGNHDYRLFPYKFQIYGLQHCGIDDTFTREHLRRAGRMVFPAYSLSDFGSIAVRRGNSHSLDHYYREINPFDDYTVQIGATRVVLLDTGPDVLCDVKEAFGRRWSRFLRGITNIEGPTSAGLSNEQVAYLSDALPPNDRTPTVVCCHAPPLNPRSSVRDAALDPSLLVRHSKDASDLAFERNIAKARLDSGTFFKNHRGFFEALRRYAGAVAVVSGHNHRRMQARFTKRKDSDDVVTVAQLPSLGHIKRLDLQNGAPGYALITAENGELSVDLRDLPTEAFANWLYWFREKEVGRMTRELSITCTPRSPRPPMVRHRVVGFAENDTRLPLLFRVEGNVRWIPGEHYFVVTSDCDEFSFTMRQLPKRFRFTLLFETFADDGGGAMRSMGLRRHHRRIGSWR